MRCAAHVLAAMTIAPTTLMAQPAIVVGPNVQVSAALGDEPHFEMVIAADPSSRDRLMACSMLLGTSVTHSETVTYVSHDGGRTWTMARRVEGEGGRESWDPTCTYGPQGVAYSAAEGVDSAGRAYIEIARSSDGGVHWDPPYRLAHSERAFLTVDNSGGVRNGWLYLHGNEIKRTTKGGRVSGMELLILQDGAPRVRSQFVASADGNYAITTGQGVVLTDGTFLGPFVEVVDYGSPGSGTIRPNIISQYSGRANALLKVLVSTDGVRATAMTVDDFYLRWPPVSGGSVPVMAADASRGPFRDRAYTVWADERSGRLQVLLSYSSDKGKTWSAPAVVSDERPWSASGAGPDSFNPTVAVNGNGIVGIAWYDRRDHRDNLGWSLRFAASLDGAESFTPSVSVSETDHVQARPPTIALRARSAAASRGGGIATTIGVHHFNFGAGHTAGLAADAGGDFHPIWSGNASGVPQLWTASIKVDGTAARNGGGELAELVDVTGKTALRFLNRIYDRTQGMVEADVVLENTSRDTVLAPLKVRVLSVGSEVGAARLATTDNDILGPGAVWDFTSFVERGRLAPGEASRSKRLRFAVSDVPAYGPGSDAVAGYVVVRTRVLAGAKSGETK